MAPIARMTGMSRPHTHAVGLRADALCRGVMSIVFGSRICVGLFHGGLFFGCIPHDVRVFLNVRLWNVAFGQDMAVGLLP